MISTADGYHTHMEVGQTIVAGEGTSQSIQMVPEGTPAQPVPSSQNLAMVNDPRQDPDPLAQPFAATEREGNLVLNALFPGYQQSVNIYPGLVLNIPGCQNKLFLYQ